MDQQAASLKDILRGSSSSDVEPRILLLDGGVSTHIQDTIQPDSFPHRELWSSGLLLDNKGCEAIKSGHEDWLRAGSDIISTVTYQCHYQDNLLPRNADGTSVLTYERMDQMFVDAVTLARQAQQSTAKPTFVAASLGCFGAALANGAEYTGDYGTTSRDDLLHFHRRKFQQAMSCQPDAVAFETIPSHLECQALAELLSDASRQLNDCRIACWVSLSCRNEYELNDGTPLSDALDVFASVSSNFLQGIGLNCCAVQHLPGLVTTLVNHMARSDVPTRAILVYPNTGEDWDAATEAWKPGTGCTAAEDFCKRLMDVIAQIKSEWPKDAGPRPVIVVGGCCRTRPDAIADLRKHLDAIR